MSGQRYGARTFAREIIMLVGAAVWWVPFYVIVALSLQNDQQILDRSLALPVTSPSFGNFAAAWQGATTGLDTGMLSSLVITTGSVLVIVVFGSLAAYVIARHTSRMSTGMYVLFVLGIVMPYQLGLIPAFVALRGMGLVGSYLGMILLYTGLEMPTAVFLYTGFLRALPRDYEEAALVDGAGTLRIFARVVFPMLAPITATVAVVTALFVWNDFFTQLVFLSGTDNQTLPVAIYGFVGAYATQWNYVFAGVVISVLPVLLFFVITQRQLVKGFASGVKG